MKRWTAPERRWGEALMSAMIPAGASPLPGIADLDLDAFWSRFDAVAPRLLRLGLRITVWVLTFWPLLHPRLLRPFHRLPAEDRDAFLEGLCASSSYLLRQLVTTLKLVATLAYFHSDPPRAFFEGVGR
jgi:hypothetical protein